jgi:hypothetical protein
MATNDKRPYRDFVSYLIDDLDYTPFDAKGGRGKMFQLFGNDMITI